jgi:DNA-directed RNA polymerase II subunit RPB2
MEKLLPHLGTDSGSFRKKAVLVSYMVRRLISSYVGHAEEDDRDHVGRKRLDAAGDLMLALFCYDFKVAFIGQAKKLL